MKQGSGTWFWEEEKKNCPAELTRGIKPKLTISKLSIFGCTVFMRKRDRDVSKLEPKALEGKFMGYTEGDNGFLVYVPNKRKVVAVRDVVNKESEVDSIPDNTETPDLIDEGSRQLGIWHPDDGNQDTGNKDEQGTSTAIKEEWHNAESVNTQETTLRRDAADIEQAALDDESTATIGSLRDSESLEGSETEDFSQTVGFFEEALEQVDRAEPRRGTRARNVPHFFRRSQDRSCCDWGWLCETQKSLRNQARWRLGPVALGNEGRGQGIPRQRDLEPSETTHRQGRHTGQMGLQSEYGTQWSSGQIQCTLCGERRQTTGRTGQLWDFAPTCKPQTFGFLLQLSAKQ